MTQDEIIAMARDAGFMTGVICGKDGQPMYPLVQPVGNGCIVELERFATLVAAKEREACAALCEAQIETGAHLRCAAAIRARGANGS